MSELVVIIEGQPSTDHRPRASQRGRRIAMRQSPAYLAWKAHVARTVSLLRPAQWPLDARYAVEVVGFMPAARYDADNLRGFLDACQGVLWTNDRQVRPVIYDYRIDKVRPRLEAQIVAFDPDQDDAEIAITIRRRPN
jgi:Holliday junction resolvase RusA-like endonuclease